MVRVPAPSDAVLLERLRRRWIGNLNPDMLWAMRQAADRLEDLLGLPRSIHGEQHGWGIACPRVGVAVGPWGWDGKRWVTPGESNEAASDG